jgi:hypothetical protein
MWFQRIFSAAKRKSRVGEQSMDSRITEFQIASTTLAQLNRLRINTSRYLPGQNVGLRSSTRRKPAFEFREHRMYVPGDDIRYVDWKASARQEHIFIKQGEYQKKINIYILLDCSASMSWGSGPKSSTALSIAAALGYSALAHGDSLTIVPLNETNNDEDKLVKRSFHLGPISGKGQFPGYLSYLHTITFHGTLDILASIHNFCNKIANGTGIVLLITDLLNNSYNLETEISEALELLPVPSWNVVVLHLLHPDELKPKLHGEFELYDIETGKKANYDINSKALKAYQERIRLWREKIELACIDNNALYALVQSDWSLNTQIIPILREMDILVSI